MADRQPRALRRLAAAAQFRGADPADAARCRPIQYLGQPQLQPARRLALVPVPVGPTGLEITDQALYTVRRSALDRPRLRAQCLSAGAPAAPRPSAFSDHGAT